MKKSVLVVVGLVLTCGCESFRHQYVPEASSAPSTRRKYSLKSCNVYEFSKRVKENHRSIMNARSFEEGSCWKCKRPTQRFSRPMAYPFRSGYATIWIGSRWGIRFWGSWMCCSFLERWGWFRWCRHRTSLWKSSLSLIRIRRRRVSGFPVLQDVSFGPWA